MSPYLAVVLALVGSYLLGSVSFAVIVGRAKGIDILSEGSGNPGMSNVARTLGRGAAAITLVGDLMKGVVASSLHLFVDPLFSGPGDELLQGLAGATLFGVAAVVGHCYPVFNRFIGGKGMATTVGVLLYVSPLVTLGLGALWWILVKVTGKASLGSLAMVVAAIPAVAIVDVPEDVPVEAFVWLVVMLLLVVYRHRENISRLRSGSERSIAS